MECLRMCIACRKHIDKRLLIRVVRAQNGEIAADKSGKADGRGAYICSKECMERAQKHRLLNKAFKCEIRAEIYESLKTELE